jgi:hypothetical protein
MREKIRTQMLDGVVRYMLKQELQHMVLAGQYRWLLVLVVRQAPGSFVSELPTVGLQESAECCLLARAQQVMETVDLYSSARATRSLELGEASISPLGLETVDRGGM